MKKRFVTHCIVYVYFFMVLTKAHAQNSDRTDSLLQVLKHAEKETAFEIYSELAASHFAQQHFDKSFEYAQQGLSLARNLSNLKYEASFSMAVGNVYMRKGKFDSAGMYFHHAVQLSRTNNDSAALGRSLSAFSNYLGRMGRYDSSVNVLNEAIEILSHTTDTLATGIAYVNLGNRYSSKGNYVEALRHQQKALAIFQMLGVQERAQNTHIAIGNAYNHMGDQDQALLHYEKAQKDYSTQLSRHDNAMVANNIGSLLVKKRKFIESKPYLLKAYDTWIADTNNCFVIYPMVNLGETYEELNQLDSADFFVRASLSKGKKCNEQFIQAAAMLIAGKISTKKNQLENARKNYDAAYKIASDIGRKDIQRDASFLLYEYYKTKKNTGDALHYYEIYNAIRDSLVNDDNTKRMATLEANFQFEQEKQRLAMLHEQQVLAQQHKFDRQVLLTNIYLGGTALLAILIFALYRSYRIKKKANNDLALKNEEISAQKSELESMNKAKEKLLSVLSHDLKNPLFGLEGSIQMFLHGAMTQERFQKYLKELQVKLFQTSEFLENLLQWTRGQLAGIKPVKTTFKATTLFDDCIKVLKPSADAKQLLIVPVIPRDLMLVADYEMTKIILRNLVANAIKFSPEGETITVSVHQDTDEFTISVHDNGKGVNGVSNTELFTIGGLSKPGTQGETGTGLGLLIVSEFVAKQGGSVQFFNKEKGSVFTFKLPVYEEAFVG